MSNRLRLIVLAVFASAGVGVAISLGLSAAPANPSSKKLTIAPVRLGSKAEIKGVSGSEPAHWNADHEADTNLASRMPSSPAGKTSPGTIMLAAAPPAQASGAQSPDKFVEQVLSVLKGIQDSQSPAGASPQAAGQLASQAAPPPANPPAGSNNADSPSPASSPARKAVITHIEGEGDDQLSITIQGEDIRKVLELLSEQGDLNILASNNVTGTVSAALKGVNVPAALDAILKSTGFVWRRQGQFIFVGTPQDFDAMQQLEDRIGTRLYRPNYAKASELQTLITPLLTQGIGSVSVTTPSEVGIAPDGNTAGGDSFAGQEALLVKDYESVLSQVDQIVRKVDTRPTQVSIEAMILSVNIDDENQFGVDFEALRDQANIRILSGNPLQNLATLDTSQSGLKVGFLDASLSLLISALETIGDTNVIATPRLMCLNKHRAEILIGSQLGYVSTTQTETSTTQSVEFLEVGTQLRIRPFISRDGLIRMEVHPELSTGSVTIDGNFTLPNKELTQVTTNIMVRDGCTVIIGGLLRDEVTDSATQIPYLGSLPVVGPAFRQSTETTKRQEILVLITPRIVYEPEACCEGENSAREFHHRQFVYHDQMNPLGKRYVGRKHFRLAQMAWAEGNAKKALTHANLAIHYDPLNRAAIDLRADIWEGNSLGEHTLPPATPASSPLDGQQIEPWLLDRLGNPTSNRPAHPYDPGQPGTIEDVKPAEQP